MFRLTVCSTLAVLALSHPGWAQSPIVGSSSHYGNAPDGIVRPWRETDAATAESGLLETLHVKVGDVVLAGQSIGELDSRAILLQLKTAQIQATAEGRLLTAQADVHFYQRKLQMLETLRGQGQATELEIERARIDLRMAEGRLRAEQDDRRVLELQAERLSQQIAERTITAPISGVVVKLHKEIGEFVAANTPQVARIADVSRLKASFYLRDSEVKKLAAGQRVQVRLSTGKLTEAVVDYVLPMADGESGLIEVQVLIENPDQETFGSRCQLILPTQRI
jgi:membrane fusion protein, multidrug efflux system